MYLGIDIGGTKTLVATLDGYGVIKEQVKFQTPKNYKDFLKRLAAALVSLRNKDFKAVGVGIPATMIDRKKGIGIEFGNLPWKNVPIKKDVKALTSCPVAIENDAKLAGLSEAMLDKKHRKVLYLTISTGIGTALVVDQKIDPNFGDGGGATLEFEHQGKIMPWEHFASGRAIVERFGKQAKDVSDPTTWNAIASDISVGLIELIAITEPNLVVFGGGVGQYLNKFIKPLNQHLKRYENPLLKLPEIRKAKRPEEAVIYGCYDLAKEVYG